MYASTANRRSPSSQDRPQSFPFNLGAGSSTASYKNPFKVSLPWYSASHEVVRGDSSLFRDSPCLPRSARGAAACRDFSVFSSTDNCELSTVSWFAHLAPRYLVYFQPNTNCPICKSFVLITMQTAGGWGGLRGAGVKASIDEDASPERAQRSEGSLCFPAALRGFFSILSAISSGSSAVDSPKFFRMRSSTISTAKSFRMRSCKNALP